MSGTLYGIGVGPGDPELMTLKADRLIRAARVVAYPAPDSGESFARAIAAGSIPAGAEEIAMVVPMRAERFPAQTVYDGAALRIAERLSAGLDVVVLCEGDPLFYGSFMYLFARLADRHPVEVVPGVSALSACAAAAARPLVARNAALTVLPGPLDDAALTAGLAAGGSVAVLKVGRHLPRLRRLIVAAGLAERAVYVSHASLGHQSVRPLAEAPEAAPYFSMILIAAEDPHATPPKRREAADA